MTDDTEQLLQDATAAYSSLPYAWRVEDFLAAQHAANISQACCHAQPVLEPFTISMLLNQPDPINHHQPTALTIATTAAKSDMFGAPL